MRSAIVSLFLVLAVAALAPQPVSALNCGTTLSVVSTDISGIPSGFTVNQPKNFEELVCFAVIHINTILFILASATLLVFFWGVAKFVLAAGDEKKIGEGKELMKWGIIALFVMFSVWGILQLFYSDLFGGRIGIPKLPEATRTP
ncbi:hypothetical protein EPN83_00300 [Patescibacteria group bacterium]|nr:MAG: hypothetical protein EPN83_00300 [Patescibacteria group bacterium]